MKIVFLGKTKKKTRVTKYMVKALRRCGQKVKFINLPRTKRLYFWTDYQKVIYNKIHRIHPDLVLIFSTDIPYSVLQKIKNDRSCEMLSGEPGEQVDQLMRRLTNAGLIG